MNTEEFLEYFRCRHGLSSEIISELRDYLSEVDKKAERYDFLLESGMIYFKPADYDGLPYGRWDLFEKTDNDDFDSYVDNLMPKVKL